MRHLGGWGSYRLWRVGGPVVMWPVEVRWPGEDEGARAGPHRGGVDGNRGGRFVALQVPRARELSA